MQKPFTIAVVGKGRSRSCWNTSQPSLTKPSASAPDLKRVNSSTSAPAMKPSFAERMIRPLGFSRLIAASARLSSSSASREKVLADSPCLSKVSQTRPSRSRSQRQCFARIFASTRSMSVSPLERFDQHRAAQPAADADRSHAAFRVVALQCFQQVQDDARTRCPDRMAKGNCPAIDVQLFFINRTQGAVEAELFPAVLLVLPCRQAAQHLRCEGFVDFPVIHLVEADAVALEDRRRRV